MRARSSSTAMVAATSAAPTAIRAICQPGIPLTITVWTWTGVGDGGGAVTPADVYKGRVSPGERGGRGDGEHEAGEGQRAGDAADATDGIHDDLLSLWMSSRRPYGGGPVLRIGSQSPVFPGVPHISAAPAAQPAG